MGRTTIEIPIKSNHVDEVLKIMAQTLEPLGYQQKIVDGETVWAKGDGVVIQMKCFGVSFADQLVILQSWMKDAVMGETALEGFMGAIPKKKMRGYLDQIRTKILAENQRWDSVGSVTTSTANSTARFCEKCGSPVRPGALFCTQCGNRVQ